MSAAVVLIAAGAAIGVGLVMFGILAPARSASSAGPGTRVRFPPVAVLREQRRRGVEPTGAPVWIAANQKANSLASNLASADIQLRPYEVRTDQAAADVVFETRRA